jgi:hypothetical protein
MTRHWVIVELSAQQDIAQPRLLLAERSEDAAERCPLASECEYFEAEIREIFHGRRQHKFRILFSLRAAVVHILHVRHGARRALGEPESDEE